MFCREYPNATPYSLYVTSCCLVAVYHVSPLSLNSSHSRTTNQPAQSRSVHSPDVQRDRASQDFVRELVSLDRGSARLTSSPCTGQNTVNCQHSSRSDRDTKWRPPPFGVPANHCCRPSKWHAELRLSPHMRDFQYVKKINRLERLW